MGANDGLKRAYREIGRTGASALELGDWPRSAYFLTHCETRFEDGALVPRKFDRNPSVGVVALLGDDPAHIRLMTKAQSVFSDILQEAREQCLSPAVGKEWATRGVWWAPVASWHVVVGVFSDNPEFSPPAQRAARRPLEGKKLKHELGSELRSDLWAFPVPVINLRLHGYRICDDGALVACFVDDDANENADDETEKEAPENETDTETDARTTFGELRRRVRSIGGAILGPSSASQQTQQLILVTLGRVLRLPESADVASIEALVSHLNAVAKKLHANETVDFSADARAVPGGWRIAVDGAPSPRARIPCPGLHEVLRIKEVSLTVEHRWWMVEHETLAKIPLARF
jgi:hypothetical protein